MESKEQKFQLSCLYGEKLGKNEQVKFENIVIGQKCTRTVKELPYQIRVSTKGRNDRRFMFCMCKDHSFSSPSQITSWTTTYHSPAGDTINYLLKDRDYTGFSLSSKLSTIMHAFTWFPFLSGFELTKNKYSLFYFSLNYSDNSEETLPLLLKVEGFMSSDGKIEFSISIVNESDESKENKEARKEIEDKYKGTTPITFLIDQCQIANTAS